MYKKRILLIRNPVSGRGNRDSKTTILQELQLAGYEVTEYETTPNWENDLSVIMCEHKYGAVVCSGGDGTMNSLINGLLKSDFDVPILYVPAGTTNDLAKSLRLSNQVLDGINHLNKNTSRLLDVGLFNQQRYFAYIASTGAFTDISYTTPQKMKNLLGHTAYVVQGIANILKEVQPVYATIHTDKAEYKGEFLFCSITNTTSIGGLLSIESEAVSFDDGSFEVILIRKPKGALEMYNMIKALVDKSYISGTVPGIEFLHTAQISIKTDKAVAWTLDGEYGGVHESIVVDVLPTKIELICAFWAQ